MKKLFWLGVSLLAAISARAGLSAEDIYEKISPSVLTLEVENFRGEKYVGSAFLSVRPGIAITAWHVVHDAKEIQARFPGNKPVKVLGLVSKDESRDLAFLQIDSTKEPDMNLATIAPRVGTKVFVIGSPQGMDFSIADGLVSQVRDVDGMRQYQLSCPISPGNSGGPVLNDRGEIVGVVSWRRADAQNLSFAVPALEVARLQPSRTNALIAVGAFADENTKFRSEQVTAKRKTTALGLSDFQKALSSRAGKKVTVTLDDGSGKQEFLFEAPKKLEAGKR